MKRFLVLLSCILFLMSCFTLSSFADTTDDGAVNSTALSYFTGVVNKLPANSDYVIYRSDDYITVMVYGFDFDLNNNIISAEDCTMVIYNQRGSNTGTNQYSPTLVESELSNFQLTTKNTSIIYSNLGSWSSVGDTSKDNTHYILWVLVLLVLLFVLYKHFRNRRHYINL